MILLLKLPRDIFKQTRWWIGSSGNLSEAVEVGKRFNYCDGGLIILVAVALF
jgi:hypothetical protein